MKARTFLAVLVVALVSAFSAAMAAQNNGESKSAEKLGASSISRKLSLTGKQQRAVWRDIIQQARKEAVPANFKVKLGAVVPGTLITYPVPMTASNQVPSLRRYQYALLENNNLLIINPIDDKVADIITR
jgi:hypothetical protein